MSQLFSRPKRKQEEGSTPEVPQSAAKKLKADDAQKLEEMKKKQNKMFYDAKDSLAQLNRNELAELLEYNKQNKASGEKEVGFILHGVENDFELYFTFFPSSSDD